MSNKASSKSFSVEQWHQLASEQPSDFRLKMPIAVFLAETLDLATLIEARMHPQLDAKTKKVTMPGLLSINTSKEQLVSANLAEELISLHHAVQQAQFEYTKKCRMTKGANLMDRATYVLSEVRNALWFVLETGKYPETLTALESLESQTSQAETVAQLSHALSQFALFAREQKDKLATVGDFDMSLIEEAAELANTLPQQRNHEQSSQASELLARRNRLLSLLASKESEVRRIFKRVFRNYPNIVRESLSAFERRARSARKAVHNDRTEQNDHNAPPSVAALDTGDLI